VSGQREVRGVSGRHVIRPQACEGRGEETAGALCGARPGRRCRGGLDQPPAGMANCHARRADAVAGARTIKGRGLGTTMKRATIIMKKRESGSKEVEEGESPSQLIDARIKELSDWRGDTLARVRILIKQADPEVVEEWKWRGVPVWSHAGIICTGETYKNVVKMTFAKGASLEDPLGLFNSSLEGNTRRAIDFHEGDRIDEKALKALIRAAVALNISVRDTARPVRSRKRPRSARGAS
jgi:hypothetical protein